MSAPLCLGVWLVYNQPTNESSCVKSYLGGRVKLYGETPTPKQVEKGINEIYIHILGIIPHLVHATSRITNLITRSILTNRNSAKRIDRAEALFTLILSSVLKLLYIYNGISRQEKQNYARDLA